jgi:hypothetical protein
MVRITWPMIVIDLEADELEEKEACSRHLHLETAIDTLPTDITKAFVNDLDCHDDFTATLKTSTCQTCADTLMCPDTIKRATETCADILRFDQGATINN